MSQPPTEPAATEVVALEHVAVRRNGRWLLRDVDWHVHRHERWVVLGPNGAGKTSMLQVASTYLGPTSGTVRLLGMTYGTTDVRRLRRRIGYAGAKPAELVKSHLPALEIVVTGKHASFVDRRWHRYEDEDWALGAGLLERLDAGHLADRKFGSLSSGERQRVLIARSLMTRPELLLLDEAATGLDLGARERLVASLSGLACDPEGPAMVLVTHHVEEIPPGFDHIALVAGGTVIATGAIDRVLSGEALSECFGQPLRLERRDDRFHAWTPSNDRPPPTR